MSVNLAFLYDSKGINHTRKSTSSMTDILHVINSQKRANPNTGDALEK